MTTVYVSIGNSDDKLTQQQWAEYIAECRRLLRGYAHQVHGEWYSASDSVHQNACTAIVVQPEDMDELRDKLTALRGDYDQDAVAWAVAPETEFI